MALDYNSLIAYIDGLYDNDNDLSPQEYNDIITYILANGDIENAPRDLIQVRRGDKVDLPELAQGEFGFTLDTEELFIGGLNGNIKPNNLNIVNVKNFGAKGDGTTDDTTSIQNAIDSLSNGGYVVFPEGTFKITSPIVIGKLTRLKGMGQETTKILQDTDNTQIIIVGDGIENTHKWSIESMTLEYSNQQTQSDVNSTGIQLGVSGYMSYEGKIKEVYIYKSYNGVATPDLTGAYAWMNILEHVKVFLATNIAFYFSGFDGAITTNTFINCYAIDDPDNPQGNQAFRIKNTSDFTMINCAVDHYSGNLIMQFESSNGTIQGLHMENCEVNIDGTGRLIDVSASMLNIISAEIENLNINVTGDGYLFYASSINSRLIINGLREKNTTIAAANNYYNVVPNDEMEIYITGYQPLDGSPSFSSFDPNNYIKHINNNWKDLEIGNRKHTYGSAAPTSGQWDQGDIVYNILPSAGGFIGWVCTQTGEFGEATEPIFKQFGSIEV